MNKCTTTTTTPPSFLDLSPISYKHPPHQASWPHTKLSLWEPPLSFFPPADPLPLAHWRVSQPPPRTRSAQGANTTQCGPGRTPGCPRYKIASDAPVTKLAKVTKCNCSNCPIVPVSSIASVAIAHLLWSSNAQRRLPFFVFCVFRLSPWRSLWFVSACRSLRGLAARRLRFLRLPISQPGWAPAMTLELWLSFHVRGFTVKLALCCFILPLFLFFLFFFFSNFFTFGLLMGRSV